MIYTKEYLKQFSSSDKFFVACLPIDDWRTKHVDIAHDKFRVFDAKEWNSLSNESRDRYGKAFFDTFEKADRYIDVVAKNKGYLDKPEVIEYLNDNPDKTFFRH